MILYHGSIIKVETPKILTNEVGRDFGFAFYTTDIKEQAERWAVRKAKIELKKGNSAKAVLNVYEWNKDDSNILIKEFDGPSMDWLELVTNCRSDVCYKHPYDVVIGSIANDNVGETVSYVVQGIMRKEDAIERLKFEKINNQIAFCTTSSLFQLVYQKSYIVEV